ncbi:DUF2721 domain-containing protein [Stenomitos frigidus]|uniref:DUF2721 domain-containing protein n=1 Tax=Stenomitos frigidus ULC18 TaxID=2107698 RepID=A0A2T1DV31_9CYAN|nr:DUF2721 domain-containing protein [Stenomitos frigidus]PSB24322.1 hypothetical protein C7B82_27325 [Stenomitos frigidus ULC18]
MPHEAVVKTINLIIAPVVMLTACGIMLNGLMVRYSWLSDRVRSVHQERLNLLDLDWNQHKSKGERLDHLNHLLPDLLRHHHQVHDVLVLIYLSILVFMLDMLVIALAVSYDVRWLHQLVVIVFLVGISILLAGMVLIAHELRTSHHSIQLEVDQNCQLCKKPRRMRK